MRVWWLPVCWFSCIGTSLADEASDLFNLSLSDLSQIKVSVASLRPESLIEAPSTVNLVTSSQWEAQGARTVAEAVSTLPGMWVTPANYGGQAVNMRGFYPSYRGVSTLLDGVTVNSFLDSAIFESFRFWQLGDLNQIEVIRGPGSSLYGADALRGVISMSSWAKADEETSFNSVRSSIADSGAKDAAFKGMYSTDQSSFKWAAEAQTQPNQNAPYRYTDVTTDTIKQSHYENEFGNHMLVASWSTELENTRTEFSIYNARDNVDNAPGLGTALTNGRSIFADRDYSGQDNHFNMARGYIDHKLTASLHTECTISRWAINGVAKLDRTREPSISRFYNIERDESKNFLQCLMHNESGTAFDWVGGLEVNQQSMDRLRAELISPIGAPTLSAVYPPEGYIRKTESGFFQSKYSIQNTAISLGARYDNFSDFASHISPRLAVIQTLDTSNSLKFMAGNAILSPTAFQRFGTGVTVLPAIKLKAEEMNTYEIAWMRNTANQVVTLTGFINQWNDGILLQPVSNTSPLFQVQYANVENSRSHGIEAEWQREWNRFKTTLAYTRSDGENKSSGLEYTGFPKNILNFNTLYYFPNKTLSVGIQAVLANQFYLREALSSDPNPPSAPSYIRVDLHANWNIDRNLAIFSDVRNLANRKNPVASIYNQEFGIDDEDAVVMLGFNWQWE